jgi:hypothetical protein
MDMGMRGSRRRGRLFCFALLAAMLVVSGYAQVGGSTLKPTMVQDTLYEADGSAAQGWLVIAWPAFVTDDGAAVQAGSTSAPLGSDGSFSVSLAPNAGATPAGSFYTVTMHLAGGATSRETWVVPTKSPARLSDVRGSGA